MQIWRAEGLRGFSRGLSASYLGVSESTIQWVLYEQLKRRLVEGSDKLQEGTEAESTGRKILRKALGAGFFAKLIATVVTYPHEVPSHPAIYNLLLDCPLVSVSFVFFDRASANFRSHEHDYDRHRHCRLHNDGNTMDYGVVLSLYSKKKGLWGYTVD
jgi:hypothetical protein